MSNNIKINKIKGSPGELYSSISVEGRDFSSNSGKLLKKKIDPFVKFCKKTYNKIPSLGNNAKYNSKFQDAINFLDWDLKAEEYTAGIKFIFFIGIFISIIIISLGIIFAVPSLSNLFGNTTLPLILSFGVPIGLFLYTLNYFRNYPLERVADEKVRALTFVPEIIGYLIMSMKLVPNLERAIEFASNHGHGKISEDLKKLLWEVKVGIKGSVAEALDELAYRWGDVSVELKKGLMKIRASVIEVSEAKRYQILDGTMAETLASIKNKLEDYGRSLSQPSMIMFYIGVLLPLLLIIILPIGSAFSNSALARPIYLILIYNIGLPIGTYAFAKKVIKRRPATYMPPKIPDNHPDLPPKNTMRIGKLNISLVLLVIILFIVSSLTSFYLYQEFGNTKKKILLREGFITEDQSPKDAVFPNKQFEEDFWKEPEHDTTPFILIYGGLLTISFCISLWLYGKSIYKRKVQLKTEKMEGEFKDALYIIASRLGENKPIEDALDHTRRFLPNSLIAKNVFGKAIDNIRILGLSLESSLFDQNYGALRNNPSNVINGAMKLLVDSVKLGVSVAAKTLMSYSIQLRNSDEVSKLLSNIISSITSTLSTMSKFIIPIVLGITTALQKIVISTLTSMASSGTMEELGDTLNNMSASALGGVSTGSMTSMGSISTEAIAQITGPTTFLIIVAIYVIQIVIIMTFFTTMIEEENLTLVKLRIAKTLPIATILFILTTIGANMLF